MSNRKDLISIAKKNGFELIRSSKHDIYKKENKIIAIPKHTELKRFTYESILKRIKGDKNE